MNILLVFPRFKYISGQPPLGIASLYSYLKLNNPQAKIDIFDGTFSKDKLIDFKNVIKNKRYHIIGLSIMNTLVSDARLLLATAKIVSSGSKIIVGGPQVTIDPEYFLKHNLADIAVIGEGEITFSELIKNECDPSGIQGVVYKKGENIIYGRPREILLDLDKLPIIQRQIFDMNRYIQVWNSMDVVSTELRGTSVIFSRGCPYQCSFCQPTLQKIFGNRVRYCSAEKIIEELVYLKKEFRINAFMFEDDTFLINKDMVTLVCDLMVERDLEMIWCCNMRADLCDYDILKKMHSAGLRKINIGIETASQRILDEVFNKKINIEQVKNAVKIAKEIGLYVQGYFMLGHPKESRKDIQNTIRFARSLDIDEASFSITTPLLGTYLFDMDKHSLEDNYDKFDYYNKCIYKNLQVSAHFINMYKKYAYLSFYSKPKRLLRQFRNIFSKNGLMKFLNKLERV